MRRYYVLERIAQKYEVVVDGKLSVVAPSGKKAAETAERQLQTGAKLVQVVDSDSGEVLYDSLTASDAGLKPAAALAALKKRS